MYALFKYKTDKNMSVLDLGVTKLPLLKFYNLKGL